MNPEDITLRFPRLDEETEVLRADHATTTEEFGFLHYYEEGMPFARYIEILEEQQQGLNLRHRFVPSTFLFAFVGDRVVGRVSIRHHLNSFLERIGGHIGYGVVPEFRRRGYATEILRQSIDIIHKEQGVNQILVTCAIDNVGSRKTIEKNGGVFQDIVEGEDVGGAIRRYWITLSP